MLYCNWSLSTNTIGVLSGGVSTNLLLSTLIIVIPSFNSNLKSSWSIVGVILPCVVTVYLVNCAVSSNATLLNCIHGISRNELRLNFNEIFLSLITKSSIPVEVLYCTPLSLDTSPIIWTSIVALSPIIGLKSADPNDSERERFEELESVISDNVLIGCWTHLPFIYFSNTISKWPITGLSISVTTFVGEVLSNILDFNPSVTSVAVVFLTFSSNANKIGSAPVVNGFDISLPLKVVSDITGALVFSDMIDGLDSNVVTSTEGLSTTLVIVLRSVNTLLVLILYFVSVTWPGLITVITRGVNSSLSVYRNWDGVILLVSIPLIWIVVPRGTLFTDTTIILSVGGKYVQLPSSTVAFGL